MKNNETDSNKLATLREVLDSFGSDIERWPEDKRAALTVFIEHERKAQQLLAEAAALDNVLTFASGVEREQENAVSARILAMLDDNGLATSDVAATGAGNNKQSIAEVVAFDHRRRVKVSPGQWQTAGMLAASLFIGILAGRAGVFDTMVRGVESTFAATTTSSPPLLTALIDDNTEDFSDEDLL
ncbi:MAG: hypothetical protein ACRBCJ_05210 [Hyphomicrobiaceae bacterium]